MGRYIDADALKEKIDSMWNGRPLSSLGARILAMIDDAPSIDIVRCKECKNNGKDDCPMRWWNDDWMEYEMLNDEEGFCSYGERKESE